MTTLYQYHGKIDLIIADPPYNTGKDFRYNDKWDEDLNDSFSEENFKELECPKQFNSNNCGVDVIIFAKKMREIMKELVLKID